MTVKQLRAFYSPDELATVYSRPYDHTEWEDHKERVSHTAEILDAFAARTSSYTLADLSCGDGAVVASSRHKWQRVILGDIHWRPGFHVTGPIEQTVCAIGSVDMFVCSETIEHVEDPSTLLAHIHAVTDHLVLTTPLAEWDDGNPQHYWGWDEQGMDDLLAAAGFRHRTVQFFTPRTVHYYTFQIWECS